MLPARSLIKKRRNQIGVLLLLVLGFYATAIEPYSIEVTRYELAADISRPLKIAHLSDLHSAGFGRREEKVIAILARERPDIIVITGDMITGSLFYRGKGPYERAAEVLQRLSAPLGVFAVRGNWEDRRSKPREKEFYRSVGVTMLVNENVEVAPGVWLLGFDDFYRGIPDLEKTLQGVPPSAFRLAIFHSPAYFDKVYRQCELALAGHTHGGQVRLPFLPAIYLPPASGRYAQGWFRKGQSQLYVNRGIGTSDLPIRFCCRPEIAIITLEPKTLERSHAF